MINRRFMIVPPALPRGGYAEKLKTRAMEFPYLLLEVANMRECFECITEARPGQKLSG
jgi:hypothetical protein